MCKHIKRLCCPIQYFHDFTLNQAGLADMIYTKMETTLVLVLICSVIRSAIAQRPDRDLRIDGGRSLDGSRIENLRGFGPCSPYLCQIRECISNEDNLTYGCKCNCNTAGQT